jgi:hypothetical protein
MQTHNRSWVASFSRLSWPDRFLLFEALTWLCWARWIVRMAPFRWIAPHLGRRMTESPMVVSAKERQLASRIQWAIQAVVRHAPIKFVCLPQALAAQWMLRRRRLAGTLYLGLLWQEREKMQAHAWVRVGEHILTGREESFSHQAVAAFSELHFPV